MMSFVPRWGHTVSKITWVNLASEAIKGHTIGFQEAVEVQI